MKIPTTVNKLLILMPFSMIMYYICMNKDNYISPFKSFKYCIWYLVIIILGIFIRYLCLGSSLYQMIGFTERTFHVTKVDGDSGAEPGSSLLPIIQTIYNVILPFLILLIKYINWFSPNNFKWFVQFFTNSYVENNEFKQKPSFFDIMIGKKPGDFEYAEFGWLILRTIIVSICLPLQSFYTNWLSGIPTEIFGLKDYTKEMVLELLLFIVSIVSNYYHYSFVKTSKETNDAKQKQEELKNENLYKMFEPLKYHFMLEKRNVKIVLPWQSGYERPSMRSKGLFYIMCIITIIGIISIWHNNKLILSFLNETNNGYSILTLINAVILVYLFGKKLINYMWDYGYNEWWGRICHKDNIKPNNSSLLSRLGMMLFLFYLFCTMYWGLYSSESMNPDKRLQLFIFVVFFLVILLLLGIFTQFYVLKPSGCASEDKKVSNFLKFFRGISGSWAWLMFTGAILLDRIIGLFTQKYSLISVGIVAIINNIIRTIMLFIANFIGFLPYWLGNINAGKI